MTEDQAIEEVKEAMKTVDALEEAAQKQEWRTQVEPDYPIGGVVHYLAKIPTGVKSSVTGEMLDARVVLTGRIVGRLIPEGNVLHKESPTKRGFLTVELAKPKGILLKKPTEQWFRTLESTLGAANDQNFTIIKEVLSADRDSSNYRAERVEVKEENRG